MKIALIHELLTMKGGAERVLRIVANMFPNAPIYTLIYNEKKLGDWFPKERIITPKHTTYYHLLTTYFPNHHFHLTKFPKAIESWDFYNYDLAISFSSAFTHGIITNGKPKHLCYVHSPARYLWDRTHDVLNNANKGILGPIKKKYLEHIFHNLRIWDSEVSARPDKLLTASKEVQRRIELYWRRDSDVIYPPIDDFWLCDDIRHSTIDNQQDYYLVVSTLVPYKRIDIAILASNKGNFKLKIVGEGPDMPRLKKLAGTTIEFLGYKQQEEIRELYTNACATIFPGDEDFGLVPIESMSCGTPVIAYKKGGALETVKENKTGIFFEEPNADSLLKIIEKFNRSSYSSEFLKSHASKFSRSNFEKSIENAIEKLYQNNSD